MAKLVVDTFKRMHLDMIDRRGKDDTFIAGLIVEAAEVAENSATLVLVDTEDMKVVFMGGVFLQWPGVAECWMIASDKMYKYRKTSISLITGFMEVICQQMKLHRLQCSVQEGFPRYQRFVEHFGFKEEGFMPKYGPYGENHFRYGRTT